MGEHNVKRDLDSEALRAFMKDLLRDLRAFEKMLDMGMIEKDVRRIGAEQELFLVGPAYKAAPLALEVLKEIDDPMFTTELALFNVEFGLDPQEFGADCLSKMERQLEHLLEKARVATRACGGHVVMTGILPTIQQSDLSLDNMTPMPRYYALNDAMNRLRTGEAYEFHIKGADDFMFRHDTVMLEACNTSFQVHFQVGHEEFAKLYNIAQAVTAPCIAVAANSPLLLGKRLWAETRIALFQQSIDTRSVGQHLRDLQPRVTFGSRWIENSVMEIFKEDITRFRVLLGMDTGDDPFDVLARGEAPEFNALRLHNGTVYRWNRPCYGISSDGKPHLRIENRVLPSGPTPLDEMANAAFWLGLMSGVTEAYGDITKHMSFDDAKTNFVRSARNGLSAVLTWVDGRQLPARELILKELAPLARQGLKHSGIDEQDIERYLSVIEERAHSAQTGSMWALRSLSGMRSEVSSVSEKMSAIASATVSRQEANIPVHKWPLAQLSESNSWNHNYLRVSQYMQTDLFTVGETELVELVASVMNWHNIHHIPVEDHDHRLIGLVSEKSLLQAMIDGRLDKTAHMPVSELMSRDVTTILPETLTLDAIRIMRKQKIPCLPVVQDGKLVGMITEREFLKITRDLLEERLANTDG